MQLFKELTAAEEVTYRKWARDNYKPLTPISGVWHPVVQDECRLINVEAGKEVQLGHVSGVHDR